jgi:hypothetical protein
MKNAVLHSRIAATHAVLHASFLTVVALERHVTEAKQMIRKLKSGEYRLYSRKKNPKTGRRRNLGTFSTLERARAHERAVQYFKHH